MSRFSGDFRIEFWGTRGLIPVPGAETVKYGGNTACVEVRCGREIIILDAGTGIRELGTKFLRESSTRASILFSHMHWDHIQGMPFFRPAYVPGNEFKLYGNKNWDVTLEATLGGQMRKPSFPISLNEMHAIGAKMEYINIDFGTTFEIGDSQKITVHSAELNHPQRAFGFRIEYNGRSLVYATDVESLPHPGRELLELASGADLLIHDAQYTAEEYYKLSHNNDRSCGHSTPEAAARVALEAGVNKLALFHHDPHHDDKTVDRMLRKARETFPNTVAASEGMVIELLPSLQQNVYYTQRLDMLQICSSMEPPISETGI